MLRRQPSAHGVLEGCDGLGEELISARKAPADVRPYSPAEFVSGEPLGEVILKQAANKASGPAPAQPEGEKARRRGGGRPEDEPDRCDPVHDLLVVPGQNRQ